jgi:predicted transposase YdaD
MSRPYDTTLKQLLDEFGDDWMQWLATRFGYPSGAVQTLNSELTTVQLAADRVMQLPENQGLLHLEVQSSWDGELPARIQEYNVLLTRREAKPVHSVAILLRRDANAQSITGTLTRYRYDGKLIHHFEYDVIRVWELSADELLSTNLGIAPLGLLTDDAEPRLASLVKQFARRVEQEVSPAQQSQLLACSSILLGLRYDDSTISPLFAGVQTMKESSVYQAIFTQGRDEGEARGEARGEAKGRVEGEAKGRVEGEAKGVRLSLMTILEQKFGVVPPELEARIQATSDLAKLQAAIRQVFAIQSPSNLVL